MSSVSGLSTSRPATVVVPACSVTPDWVTQTTSRSWYSCCRVRPVRLSRTGTFDNAATQSAGFGAYGSRVTGSRTLGGYCGRPQRSQSWCGSVPLITACITGLMPRLAPAIAGAALAATGFPANSASTAARVVPRAAM